MQRFGSIYQVLRRSLRNMTSRYLKMTPSTIVFESLSSIRELTFTLSICCPLKEEEGKEKDDDKFLKLPPLTQQHQGGCGVIISEPDSKCFELRGSAALASPLTPYLDASELRYDVQFNPRSDTDWNVRDQVIVHTRYGSLQLILEAKTNESVLHPLTLPQIKSPTERMFQFIEARAEKNTGPEAIWTNDPRTTKKKNQGRFIEGMITNQYDAQAVISRLRAARQSTTHEMSSPSKPTLDDLEAFNALIRRVKIEHKTTQESSEHHFYRRMIIQQPSKSKTPIVHTSVKKIESKSSNHQMKRRIRQEQVSGDSSEEDERGCAEDQRLVHPSNVDEDDGCSLSDDEPM